MPTTDGVEFSVWSGSAARIFVCLFDSSGDLETDRIELEPRGDGVFSVHVPGLGDGTRYGLRADGDYAPERGLWFDPDKLLVDPYAVEIDRRFLQDQRLAEPRGTSVDTAPLVPKAIARALPATRTPCPPLFQPGGLVYEVPVRAFSMRHPGVPPERRGTLAALSSPRIIAHLKKLDVTAVELMPVTAWIDERHLPPLGLRNGWGYNPVTFMALDPLLAPGGLAELRDTVAALHASGIGVILDVVFNHTGEADACGPTLSLRGLDGSAYFRHRQEGSIHHLVNDSGTGNTLACDVPIVRELVLDALRHFVLQAGVDGFRFDLGTVLGRRATGFDAEAPLLAEMCSDPVLRDRILIAEPWDIGPGGYQLGNFPPKFLEWNDRYRDDVRRFWRGDRHMAGALATRLAGSSDIFERPDCGRTRSVNFVAAHDGFTLADLVAHERRHNWPNGEDNRDGHADNFSWNCGVEGETDDAAVRACRQRDMRALLATLFCSRGTIMLTAGDEFGRSQGGNNNAYAQDNMTTWLDWQSRDTGLERHVVELAAIRSTVPALRDLAFLTGKTSGSSTPPDVEWLTEGGEEMKPADWEDPDRRRLAMLLGAADPAARRLAVLVNGDTESAEFALPAREDRLWHRVGGPYATGSGNRLRVPGRTVALATELPAGGKA